VRLFEKEVVEFTPRQSCVGREHQTDG